MKFINTIAKVWALLAGVLLIAIMVVTSINAFAFGLDRLAAFFDHDIAGIYGYEDFVRLIISCAALMFLPYCQLRRGHIAVDFFTSRFPPSIIKFLDKVGLLTMLLLAIFLSYWMVLGLLETRSDHALSSILGWPEWLFYIPGLISLLLWALVTFMQLLNINPRSQSHELTPNV